MNSKFTVTEDIKRKISTAGVKLPSVAFDEMATSSITPEMMTRTYNKISGSCLKCGYQHFTEEWDCKNCLALTKLENICD